MKDIKLEREVLRAQQGEKDAFVRCIEECEIGMYRVAKSILKNDQDCSDAMQETIIKAYKLLKTLKEPAFFRTWLIRIVINESRRLLKERSKVVLINSTVNESYTDSYYQIEIQEMIESLDCELRTIVTLYYIEDISIREIAKILDLPNGTVKSRLARARKRLTDSFGLEKGLVREEKPYEGFSN